MPKLTSFDSLLKDMYPRAGERIKQWVIDERQEAEWERRTCPRVDVPEHKDNTGLWCSNSGGAQWHDLDHHACYECGDLHKATATRADIAAWRALKAERPPICADRDKLSDEIAPDLTLAENPILRAMRGKR